MTAPLDMDALEREFQRRMRRVIATALIRNLCKIFDDGGESCRSARARMAEAAFQLLNDPSESALQVAYDECDANPASFLADAERVLTAYDAARLDEETG